MSENRQAFERFISSPPFERDIKRFQLTVINIHGPVLIEALPWN